ncbi:MAG: exosome complex RNA-binding protein Csl4 [Candidatus Poseidonia sp.]|nr:exosome complex RNA-binding protein Csl4 [Poseidonia sp.]
MTASLVTPGSIIAKEGEHEHGEGTSLADGNIISTVVGYVRVNEGSISVSPSKPIVEPVVGDTVLCEVVKLNEKNGEAMILAVEGKPGSIQPQHLYGQFFVTGLVDRFMHQTSDALRRRDVCRAVVKEVEPVVRLDFRERDDCGVLHAICPPCGDTLQAELDGDWNVKCPTCGYQAYRALADNYGAGWAELDQGASALNNSGKRWGSAAEAMFAKGPAGRATFIAADVREDGRERTYFRFEGQGGGRGGGRQRAAPGTRLFVGGLPRDVGTDELSELFKSHGDMTDCVVLTDDAGVNRGFGFVTYAEKSMADAAIKALDGHRINGRRIGVRDADDDKKKGRKERKEPEGLKLYIGNLPFSATQDQLKAMVAAHATVNEVILATGPGGKAKGFGFVFIAEKDKGEAVVSALNNSEVEGRKIKVDIAKAKGGKGGRGGNRGGDGGGKSARELQALREEGEGGKKRNRRPRPKKD